MYFFGVRVGKDTSGTVCVSKRSSISNSTWLHSSWDSCLKHNFSASRRVTFEARLILLHSFVGCCLATSLTTNRVCSHYQWSSGRRARPLLEDCWPPGTPDCPGPPLFLLLIPLRPSWPSSCSAPPTGGLALANAWQQASLIRTMTLSSLSYTMMLSYHFKSITLNTVIHFPACSISIPGSGKPIFFPKVPTVF